MGSFGSCEKCVGACAAERLGVPLSESRPEDAVLLGRSTQYDVGFAGLGTRALPPGTESLEMFNRTVPTGKAGSFAPSSAKLTLVH